MLRGLNFQNMDSQLFEVFARDIMSRILGIELQFFCSGKDGGIDLTNDTKTHEIVVQCKHYKDADTAYRALLKELAKLPVMDPPPKKYYIFTTVSFSAKRIADLRDVFEDYMDSDDNIIYHEKILTFFNDFTNIDIWNRYKDIFNYTPSIIQDNLEKKKLEKYYNYYIRDFEKVPSPNSILGGYSLKEAYIRSTFNSGKDLEESINQWYTENASGIMLLHGQPGHGKTTFCKKMLYSFVQNSQKEKSYRNIFLFSLNSAKSNILDGDKISIRKAFCVPGTDGKELFSPEECKNSLIFLDAYDELATEAYKKGYTSIISLLPGLQEMADLYQIHFIITSRTTAVKNDIDILKRYDVVVHKFEDLSEKVQRQWIQSHNTTDSDGISLIKYWDLLMEEVEETRASDNTVYKTLKELFGIHVIFRIIVHNRFHLEGKAYNKAKLYHELFVSRASIHGAIEALQQKYEQLAFHIFENNEDCTIWSNHGDSILLNSYYINHEHQKQEIGFIHRSFYQYFLASYFQHQLSAVSNSEMARDFLLSLACRRIDNDILSFFRQIIEEDTDNYIMGLKLVLEQIDKTECILPSIYDKLGQTAEHSPFNRCNNIFCNAINLSSYFIISNYFNKCINLKKLFGKYNCEHVRIGVPQKPKEFLIKHRVSCIDLSDGNFSRGNFNEASISGINLSRANLTCANLHRADLSETNLSRANLTGCNLYRANLTDANCRGANFSEANLNRSCLIRADFSKVDFNEAKLNQATLNGANLCDTNFSGASLSEAKLIKVKLDKANFSNADLSGTDLSEASLIKVNLYRANLRGANLSGANLSGADLSEADLTDTNLYKTDLRNSILSTEQLHYICLNEGIVNS